MIIIVHCIPNFAMKNWMECTNINCTVEFCVNGWTHRKNSVEFESNFQAERMPKFIAPIWVFLLKTLYLAMFFHCPTALLNANVFQMFARDDSNISKWIVRSNHDGFEFRNVAWICVYIYSNLCRAPIRIVDETNFEMITNPRQPTLMNRICFFLSSFRHCHTVLHVVIRIIVTALQ